jgi:hypothetical protein
MADNKLLVALSAISTLQAKASIATEQVIELLLDYITAYPNDGIVYWASNMILCARTDAGADAHIFFLEDDPFPRLNGAVLSIA